MDNIEELLSAKKNDRATPLQIGNIRRCNLEMCIV